MRLLGWRVSLVLGPWLLLSCWSSREMMSQCLWQPLAHLCLKWKESESEVTQLCLTVCDPVDCSPPGSSVHGILQARILEWVAISFPRVSSQPRDKPRSPALQADALTSEPLGECLKWGPFFPRWDLLGWVCRRLQVAMISAEKPLMYHPGHPFSIS